MMAKKISIITPKYPPSDWGGLAVTVKRVADILSEAGFEVHVLHIIFSSDNVILLDENTETEKREGLTIHRITLPGPLPESKKIGDSPHGMTLQVLNHSLEKLHRKIKFHLFHSFFLFPGGYVSSLLAKRSGIPSIVTLVGNDVNKHFFNPEKVASCMIALEKAHMVTALSNDLLNMADSLTPLKHKGKVIYNSVSIPPFSWQMPQRDGPFIAGCAGLFKYAKGLPYLFKAVKEIASKEKILLELAGQVREEEKHIYYETIEQTGIEPYIKILPPIPPARVKYWLTELDAFILPSLSEGCPNILMEAMASGVPSIATKTGANDILIEDGLSGILVEPGDSKGLEEGIYRIIKDKELRISIGKNARERMKDFSPEREKKEWLKLYSEIL